MKISFILWYILNTIDVTFSLGFVYSKPAMYFELRRLVCISGHKWVLLHFTTSYSGALHHTTMLFNREITLEAKSMKFCLMTYIFLKLFLKVILEVTTLERLMKIYLLLKELQQYMHFPHSFSIINIVSYEGLFLKNLPGDPCKKSAFVFSIW